MRQNKESFLWWKGGVIYHIYPRSFKDSDHDGIGDLRGIIQKIDYLQELGVDAVWLSPVYPSPLVDGGYDISDYKKIHPDYGTLEDFRQLLDIAHQKNIRIIMDLVLNHTSDKHPWFLESRSSIDNPKRDWYIWQSSSNGKKPNNWKTNFGKKAWKYDTHTNEYYYHSFFWEQPDLNWRNPEVRKAMFDIISFWLDMGIDGFRLDVINMLFKDETLRDDHSGLLFSERKVFSRNQPEVYEFLKEFRFLLDQYPNAMSVGEIYAPPPGDTKLAAGFLGNGSDMLHLAFDFSLIFAVWRASAYYKVIKGYYESIPQMGWPCFFLSNHDIGRSVKRIKWAFHQHSRAKLHAVLLLTLKGTPFIYYGDEIGMENTKILRHKIRDLYGKLFYPFYKGRDGARTPMQWNNTVYAGFSLHEPWLPVNENYLSVNVETESGEPYSIYSIYKKLIALKKQYHSLQSGEIKFLNKGNKNVLVYYRYLENEKIVVLLNFGWNRKRIKIKDIDQAVVIFSTQRRISSITEEKMVLEPHEGLVLRLNTGGS